jgi:hypothetical protein
MNGPAEAAAHIVPTFPVKTKEEERFVLGPPRVVPKLIIPTFLELVQASTCASVEGRRRWRSALIAGSQVCNDK